MDDFKERVLARLDKGAFFHRELGELPRARGQEVLVRCVFHEDQSPSLSVNLETGVFHCFGCGAKGDIFEFYRLRHGVDFKEALAALARQAGVERRDGRRQKKFVSLTLAEFSRAKQLPVEFLVEHGVREVTTAFGTTRVEFPYYDGKHQEVAVRQRYGGKAKDEVKFLWPKGTKALPYGLWRLKEFQAGGWLLLVEGESDTLTGWRHGLPVIGIPGKENYSTLRRAKLQCFTELYLWEEPDAAVRRRPEEVLFREKVAELVPGLRVIPAPAGVKDISEAHVQGLDVAETIEAGKKKAFKVAPPPAPPEPPRVEAIFNLSDLGNAKRLVGQHGRDLRYSYLAKKWLVWTGKVWVYDTTGEVERRAKRVVAGLYQEAGQAEDWDRRKAIGQFALRSENQNRILAMVRLAQSEAGIAVTPEMLDRETWLLNCDNGTLELRSGKLREHRREDLITRMAPVPYEPEAEAEIWEKFLFQIQDNDLDMVAFIMRAFGYALTGSTREQCLFILWGNGANGKSTLLNAVREVLGNYALHTPTETLLSKNRPGDIPADVARLDGPRFVTASEVDRGRRLAESLIKELTGRDTVTARFLYGDYFEYVPQFKLFLSTNNAPVIRGSDDAIWRRIYLMEFKVQIPEVKRDPELGEKLRGEQAGILAYLVRACLDWQDMGLAAPEKVRVAVSRYRAQMDVLQEFIEDRCEILETAWATAKELYQAYTSWAEDNGLKDREILKQRTFGLALGERGFMKERSTGGVRLWRGLGLQDK